MCAFRCKPMRDSGDRVMAVGMEGMTSCPEIEDAMPAVQSSAKSSSSEGAGETKKLNGFSSMLGEMVTVGCAAGGVVKCMNGGHE